MASFGTESPLKNEGLEISYKGDEDEDEYEEFAAVLAKVDLVHVAIYASRTRKSIHPDQQEWSLPKIGSPIFGSYHVLYPVIFEDGVRWLFEVPANGTLDQYSSADADSLRSEALTMRLLRQETTIPVPEVFAFNNSCDNECGCPFILISYIEGEKLSDVWHDKTSPKDIVEARRTQALQDVAASTIQLEKYSFDKGGSLVFDHNDQLSDVSSIRLMDNTGMLKRLKNDDPDDSPLYIEAGPFLEPKTYYTAPLDHRGEQQTNFETGSLLLLRMFFDLMQEPCDGRKPFVLTHPDFDIQNFIVSEDGELRGIIDWDSISSVPRTIGNEQLPGWLTRDWDPTIYVWNEEMEQGIKPDDIVWEDSPATLKFYRSVYASAMRSCRNNESVASSTAATLTTTSLIYQNLLIAASDPIFMTEIILKVFEEIASLVQDDLQDDAQEDEEDEFYIFDVTNALAENRRH